VFADVVAAVVGIVLAAAGVAADVAAVGNTVPVAEDESGLGSDLLAGNKGPVAVGNLGEFDQACFVLGQVLHNPCYWWFDWVLVGKQVDCSFGEDVLAVVGWDHLAFSVVVVEGRWVLLLVVAAAAAAVGQGIFVVVVPEEVQAFVGLLGDELPLPVLADFEASSIKVQRKGNYKLRNR